MGTPVARITGLLILAGLFGLFAAETSYYVKPTPDTQCPQTTDPCLTLSEYVQDPSQYFISESHFIFLPGEHNLDEDLAIENLTSITFTGDLDSLPEITSRIVCTKPAFFNFSTIQDIQMSALAIIACGSEIQYPRAVFLNYVEHFSFVNSSFEDNQASAILLRTSDGTIEDTVFRNNSGEVGGGVVVLDSSVAFIGNNQFVNNMAMGDGGGIYAENSTVSFNGNTVFRNNSGEVGGGVAVFDSAVTFIGNNQFVNNMAMGDGGGIYAENSTIDFNGITSFVNNTAPRRGGGLFAANTTLTSIQGVTFFDDNAAFFGGGVYAQSGSKLAFHGNSTFIRNTGYFGGEIVVTDCELSFSGNNTFAFNQAQIGGGVQMDNTFANFSGQSVFIGNQVDTGGGIYAMSSEVIFDGTSKFFHNSAGSHGGAINAFNSILHSVGDITVEDNFAKFGGGIYLDNSHVNFSGRNIIHNNSAFLAGGLDLYESGALFAGKTTFSHNSGFGGAGGIGVFVSTLFFEGEASFISNYGAYGGGVYGLLLSNVSFNGNNTFVNNTADGRGGAIYITNSSSLSLAGISTFSDNSANTGSLLYTRNSELYIDGVTKIVNNTVSSEGNIYCNYTTSNISGDITFANNSANFTGGAMYIMRSAFQFEATITFKANSAINGGSVYMKDHSSISFNGSTVFQENRARYGGGIFAKDSQLSFSNNYSFVDCLSETQGGAIYATNSEISFTSSGYFTGNVAELGGGGILLEQGSNVFFNSPLQLFFVGNRAARGGALYFIDVISLTYCSDEQITTGECFFEVSSLPENPAKADVYLVFTNNSAQEAGTVLYGGMLDTCTFTSGPYDGTNGLVVFEDISAVNSEDDVTSTVSSDPFRICLCENNTINCGLESPPLFKSPGESFNISVVAVGQGDGSIPAIVRSYFPFESGSDAELGEGERIRQTGKTCTNLQYNVYSPDSTEEIILYAEGPCRDIGMARHSINVMLLPCPDGFELSYSSCVCEARLQRYTNSCNINTGKIKRSGDFWMSPSYDGNGSYEGLILHPHCPFDYCLIKSVEIKLSNPDAQCDSGHSGVLCGACQHSLSLALGSSQCLHCSNSYLALLIPFALAGIALVMLIVACNLTVANGAVNGLIFYANIIAVNRSIFFPRGETNILTVFIAWINLDLGIETCFFDGMDTYGRTWLQFVFPVYVWILVGSFILVSKFSRRIAKSLGNNPVAVLATLFLLSYAKLLRTIITALSFTFLQYPDGSEVAVWLYDGNLQYLKGSHIPLFLFASLALLFVFLPYTMFLFLGQWLQALSHWKILSLMNSARVKVFLDVYHAPYCPKHRYWTGFLLLLRCLLFLVFAFNALGNTSVNLLAITSATLGLAFLARLSARIYQKWYLELLEASFFLNLGILAAGTYHIDLAGGNQAALVYLSVSIAFITFVTIAIINGYLQLKKTTIGQKLLNRTATFQLRNVIGSQLKEDNPEEPNTVDTGDQPLTPPTTTYVQLREPLLEDK